MCRVYCTLWVWLVLLFAPSDFLLSLAYTTTASAVMHLHCFPPKHFIKGENEVRIMKEVSSWSHYTIWDKIFTQMSSWCYTLTVWIHLVGCERLHALLQREAQMCPEARMVVLTWCKCVLLPKAEIHLLFLLSCPLCKASTRNIRGFPAAGQVRSV